MSSYILVVEDDTDLRDSLCDALEMESYQAVGVEHGQAALRHLRSGASLPCLILLDLMMPVMDGWTFRDAMLADPSLASIPVVVMTAVGRQGLASPPAQQVLHTPLRMERLFQAVQAHCAH